jgi:RND family efflux transporter MFP subunit
MNSKWALAVALAALLPLRAGAQLATATVRAEDGAAVYVAEGTVEAIRQTEISAQVAGRVTMLAVKAGDAVRRGQVLLRIDAEVADRQEEASRAQVAQADAQLDGARAEFERSERLYAKRYLSQAAMDRARERLRSATAQADAMRAQAGVTGAGVGFHTVGAPYDAIVAAVAVERGDLALPGRPLLTLFDPAALRVAARVPESVLPLVKRDAAVRVELPNASLAARQQTIAHATLLPTVDPQSHSAQLRVDLPRPPGVEPGQYARVELTLQSAAKAAAAVVPRSAVISRSELEAVYIVDDQGRARLRQVRTGRALGDEVEILAGLRGGERVALDPIAAAAQTGLVP